MLTPCCGIPNLHKFDTVCYALHSTYMLERFHCNQLKSVVLKTLIAESFVVENALVGLCIAVLRKYWNFRL